MFTPQQIDQISFNKSTFGGYNMDEVDAFLEPLTEDYLTLYKENALLNSKMRVLVGKLEEYRNNDASMKEAVINAQKTCEQMVLEAQQKCEKMLSEANTSATANNDALVAAENDRVQEAKKLAAAKIEEIQSQMRSCIQALDRIKQANEPAAPAAAPKQTADEMADEISQNLEAIVGTTVDHAPKAAPRQPLHDTTTSKFANLQFGRNYAPGNRSTTYFTKL